MEINMEQKIELNKKIKNYNGNNTFLISLQKQLKSKKTKKEEFNDKQIKVLSDRQYEVAKDLL